MTRDSIENLSPFNLLVSLSVITKQLMLRVKIMRMVASLGVQTDFLAVLAQPRQCNSRMAKALAYSGHYLKAHIDQSYRYEQSSEQLYRK